MNTQDAIEKFRLLMAAAEPSWRWDHGHLHITTNKELESNILHELEVDGVTPLLTSPERSRQYESRRMTRIPPGTSIILQVPKIASKLAIVASFEELVKLPAVQNGDLAACIICGDGLIQDFVVERDDVAPTPELQFLKEVNELWRLLRRMSDHEQEDGTLLFFGVRRLDVGPGFAANDLKPSEIPAILKFARDVDKEEVRKEIFKAMLAELLIEQKPEAAFRYLLTVLNLFCRRLREGLAIYLSSHSPAKLQKEAEVEALGYTEKIDKLVTAMEAKSLTIPAALILVYKESDPGGSLLSGGNLVAFVTTSLYLMTMIWAHLTQRELVDQLDGSVSSFERQLQLKGLDCENPVLGSVCPSLKTRIKHARWASWTMCFCSALPLLCVLLQALGGMPRNQQVDSGLPAQWCDTAQYFIERNPGIGLKLF